MAKPIVISILGDTRDLVGKLDSSESRLGRFGGAAGKMGLAVAAGAAAAGGALVVLGAKSVGAASDAQQSVGATQTVYGKYADTVIAKSNAAAEAVGLSANAYRENSNLLGALLKNQGVEQDKLAAKTDNLIGLSADLAATYGGTTTTAVEAMSAAYKGEFNQLEKYGISLKASTIAAELAARGQDKLTGAALDAAKQQATTDLITRQAGDAVGAFGRETDTLAHKQQVFGAQLEDVSAKVGTLLLPVLTTLLGFASSSLIPALEGMATPIAAFAASAGEKLLPVITQLGGFLTANLLPALAVIGGAIMGTIVPALVDLGGYVLSTVVPAVVSLYGTLAANLRPILAAVADVFATRIAPTLALVVTRFKAWLPTILSVVGTLASLATAVLGKVLPPVIRFAGFLIGTLVPVGLNVVGTVLKIIGAVVSFGARLVDGVKDAARFATGVGDKIGSVLDTVKGLPGRVLSALGSLGGTLLGAGRDLIQGLIDGISEKFQALKDKLSVVTDLIPDWKGPPARDAVLLRPAGRSIMGGLIDGLGDQLPDLRKSLGQVTRLIGGTALPALAAPTLTEQRPRFSTSALTAAAGAWSGRHEVTVTLDAEQLHELERGRRLAVTLRPYLATGGTL